MAMVPLPEGMGAIFELQFEDSGDPLIEGGFDRAYGGILDATRVTEVSGGKLIVWTTNGDIGKGDSANDFAVVSDAGGSAVNNLVLFSRFDNTFPAAITAQSFAPGIIPGYAQVGILVGTGNQGSGEWVKLVLLGLNESYPWALQIAVSGGGADLWKDSELIDTALYGLDDVAYLDAELIIDKAASTVTARVTLYATDGTVLGGLWPEVREGFATAGSYALTPAIAGVLSDPSTGTGGGVNFAITSNDYLDLDSYEASWQCLALVSPEVAAGPVPAPTNAISGGAGRPKRTRNTQGSASASTDGKGIPQRIRGIATRGQIITGGQGVLSRPPLMSGALSQTATGGGAALRKTYGLAASGNFVSGGSAGILRIRNVATNPEPAITDGRAKPKPSIEDMAALGATVTGGETFGRRRVQLAATSASTTDGSSAASRTTQAGATSATVTGGNAQLTDLWTRAPAPTGAWVRQAQP